MVTPTPIDPAADYAVPSRVASEVERILNGAARRLLNEQINGDAIGASTGRDAGSLDSCTDQGALLIDREPIPIRARINAERDAYAA
jgi:hypothetical protein